MSGKNLTLQTSPTYNASGKFGQSLSGGNGYSANQPITAFPFTLEAWVKATASGSVEVAAGRASVGWFGKAANNTAVAHFGAGVGGTGPGNDITLASAVNIADGAWHHLRLVVTSAGGTFSVDGVQASTSSAAPTFDTANKYFGVRAFFNTDSSATATFPFQGEVDEVAVFNTALPTTYTSPVAAYAGIESGQVALYHLDGNGVDSQGAGAATAVTLSGPTSGTVAVASTAFTVGADGTITGTVVVTPSDGGAGGTFAPTTVSISSASPTATFTYTAATTGAKTISVTNNGSLTNPSNITYTAAAAAAGALDTSKILFSPGNWSISAGSAKTINDGAYFSGSFTGASCTLGFDISATSDPKPKLSYRVDKNGPWTAFDLAATVTLAIPTENASMTTHTFEVVVQQTSEANSRWAPQNTAVVFNGITLAGGGVQSTVPTAKALKGLFFGDSIFNGVNSLNLSTGDSTTRGRASMAYPFLMRDLLDMEVGVVGFGGQGWVTTGGGSVPVFPSTYASLFSGTARVLTGYDAIVINQGQNDVSAATSAQVTTVLNALIAATDRRTKIIILVPLSGRQAANLQAGIAACTAPARVSYVDTTGWFTAANSVDNVHPVGWEHQLSIAPKCAAALRPIIAPVRGARTLRTINLAVFQDAAGTIPAADATALVWSFFDQVSPDALAIPADSGSSATISGGALALQVYSTKSAGAQGYLVLATADGTKAFKGLVTLS